MEHTRSWYIPRPSLSSNSSSSTSKSHDSIRRYHRDSEVIDIDRPKAKRNSTKNATASSSSSSLSSHHRHPKNQKQTETCVDGDCDSPKRGSRSSQGSSDSEQSIHSASSLLLTVANLESFAKIHEHNPHLYPHHPQLTALEGLAKMHNQSAISIHPNRFFSPPHLKTTKELDQLSTASSTHFTMVNGFGRDGIKRKGSYICKRSQQVSILIITMSVLFLIGISTAVILLEMRNREMPR